MFLAERWRHGTLGALRLGAAHGARCVGCCWALMAALFAVGVMSLGWMAVIAGLIAAEKLLPWRERPGWEQRWGYSPSAWRSRSSPSRCPA